MNEQEFNDSCLNRECDRLIDTYKGLVEAQDEGEDQNRKLYYKIEI